MRRVRGLTPALVALVLALTASPAAVAAAPLPTTPTPDVPDVPGVGAPRYVALGDSWAAGSAAGALDADSGDCRRSTVAYPALLAAAADERGWASQACAAPRPGSGNSQFSALDPQTRVVTATVGADAVRLGELARACSSEGTADGCDAAVAATDEALAALPQQLDAALGELREAAPAAALTVAGYPLLTEGRACPTGAADAARAEQIDAAVTRLDRVLADRGRAWGADFVDVRPAFAGHGVCSAEPWVTPLTEADPRTAGAATAEGHARGYVAALEQTVTADLGSPLPSDPLPSDPLPSDPLPSDVPTPSLDAVRDTFGG